MNQITAQMMSPSIPRSVLFGNQINATNAVAGLFGGAGSLISGTNLVGLLGGVYSSLKPVGNAVVGGAKDVGSEVAGWTKSKDGAVNIFEINVDLLGKALSKLIGKKAGGTIGYGGTVFSYLYTINKELSDKDNPIEKRLANATVSVGIDVVAGGLIGQILIPIPGVGAAVGILAAHYLKKGLDSVVVMDNSLLDYLNDGFTEGFKGWITGDVFRNVAQLPGLLLELGKLTIGKAVTSSATAAWDWASTTGVDTAKKVGDAVVSSATSFACTAWNWASTTGVDTAKTVGTAIVSGASSVVTAVSSTAQSVANTVSTTVATVSSAVSSAVQTVGATIRNTTQTVTNTVSSTVQTVSNTVSNVATPAVNAAARVAAPVVSVATPVVNTVANGVQSVGGAIGSLFRRR